MPSSNRGVQMDKACWRVIGSTAGQRHMTEIGLAQDPSLPHIWFDRWVHNL
jgi:hypothetical protein